MLIEIAFTRTVAIAAEIVDGISLRRVTSDIVVAATGLSRAPVVNASGLWVWLAEAGANATAITVASPRGAYSDATGVPVAPPDRCRIELAPTPKYQFPSGSTAMRGTLVETAGPAVAVAGASVRLQWQDDTGWNDAPLVSLSDVNGNFAAALRLANGAEPHTAADGLLNVRLRIDRAGESRVGGQLSLRPGAVGAVGAPVIWDQLLAYP
jgi:hypothetical protein